MSGDEESEGDKESGGEEESGEDIEVGEGEGDRRVHYQRKVYSIDSALEETNYTPMKIPDQPKSIKSISKGNNKEGIPDIHYEFLNQHTPTIGRQRQADIIHGRPGPAAKANRTPTPIDAFQKYFTIDMVNLIVRHTNSKITSMLSHVSEEMQRKYNFLRVTSEIEMKPLIGLILYRGLYKLNNFTATKLFSDTYGPPMFGAVMRRDRFFFLQGCHRKFYVKFQDFPGLSRSFFHFFQDFYTLISRTFPGDL